MKSLKVSYCSDLHMGRSLIQIDNIDASDVLILAGDIVETRDITKYTVSWISDLCSKFRHVIYVIGSHDHYFSKIDESHSRLKSMVFCDNFHVLSSYDKHHIFIDDILFVGTTLWSDIDISNEHLIQNVLNDFRYIRNYNGSLFRPEDARNQYKFDSVLLATTITQYKDSKLCVITHHAPSFRSVNPRYENDRLNSAFVSNLDNIVGSENIIAWIHGHTHDKQSYYINDTYVGCNPRGYIGESLDEFKLETIDLYNMPDKELTNSKHWSYESK